MLVTSSQSSTQRPLGLSVEELFALDRQYRRIEQQQQHLAQLQAQTRITSSNLNRLASRSLDLISSPLSSSNPLTVLPSLEVHGHGYTNRPPPPPPPSTSTTLNYPRSHSIDQLRYIPPPPPPPVLKHTYPQRSKTTDVGHQNYPPKYRSYMQQPVMPTGNSFIYDLSSPAIDYSDNRASCKLRRQQPIKRESSRRIVVRPVVHRRREPSISSSCESLDQGRSFPHHRPIEPNPFNQSVPFTPSTSLIADVIDDLTEETKQFAQNDSFSDDGEINLYEMRLSIGKSYDTSDISVQLEGPKILIHCHTIEPTDKRGNYRKHEFKSELLVPDVVNDQTIVAYLTEDGQLIVEGKYHLWAWKEIQNKRRIEREEEEELDNSSEGLHSKLTTEKNDGGGLEEESITPHIERLDHHRTVIHIGDSTSSNIRNRSDVLHNNITDGQYLFTNAHPPLLIYHLRLPFETLMDSIRIQSDPELNLLNIFIEQEERNLEKSNENFISHSTSRLCRLPKDYRYDYNRLHVQFLKDNFIRIELPTLN